MCANDKFKSSPFYRLYDELKDHGIFYNRWRQTKIWLSLEARDGHAADSVKTFLKNVMPDIERVLNQGGTSALDFTLHDSEHSFRVSQRMAELVPNGVFFQPGRLRTSAPTAVSLLTRYWHDAGAWEGAQPLPAPARWHTGHRARFNCASSRGGSTIKGQPSIPLPDNLPIDARLSLAAELATHYSRFKHNDWSEEWIRKRLKDKR